MFLIFAAIVAALFAVLGWRGLRRRRQLRFLQQYRFDAAYRKAIWRDYPYLSDANLAQAEEALRQFFIMHWLAPRAQLQMPSRLADALWHAFILDTRRYQHFCQRAFGHMFHHLPAQAASAGVSQHQAAQNQAAQMQPSWNAAMHSRRYMVGALLGGIPLLFALDAAAALEDGWLYPPELLDQWAAAFAQAAAAASSSMDSSSSPVSGSDSSSYRDDSSSAGDSSDVASSSTSADSDGGSSSCSGSSCGGSSCGGGSSD